MQRRKPRYEEKKETTPPGKPDGDRDADDKKKVQAGGMPRRGPMRRAER